ncbi:MAG: helix-turn-helix transcriptional regulator [Bacteroidota bacterium]|nr:helix-turn-helix transcriptional regulator [Bacteroidota bacterium]
MKRERKSDPDSKICTKDIEKLSKRIKALRMAKGYSSYEYFAYEHNISRSQFGRYEKGEDLRYSSLMKVIRAFGMTAREFFSEGFD